MKIRREKVALSSSLEKAFFARAMDKKQLASLKAQCVAYHEGRPPRWKTSVLPVYSAYFGLLTALKVKAAVQELGRAGYFKIWKDEPVKIIDFGAGTLGASLGAIEALKEFEKPIEGLLAIDRQPEACLWAFETFEAFLPAKRSIKKNMKRLELHKPCLFLFSNVLVEIFDRKNEKFEAEFFELLESANENVIFLFVEPAHYEFNQYFLGFRDRGLEHTQVLLPCPHQKLCPALKQNEWCHEERDYRAPSAFWNLVESLGFQKRRLNFSFLALGHQKSVWTSSHARVVSQALESKGLSERWLCADGKRWKEARLHREKREGHEAFFESSRGDMLKKEGSSFLKAFSTEDEAAD